MRDKRTIILLAIGVVLAVLGLVGLLHYHHSHVLCSTMHVSSCGAVRRRYLGSIVLLIVGVVVLAGSAGEAVARRR